MVKKTVVLCSGGIDSVGLLWNLLKESDEEILVQHIRHKEFHNFWEYEEDAFKKAMDYLKRAKPTLHINPKNYQALHSNILYTITIQ